MEIKELNKKQLILLTLLITFVVSIATGIVTVSLMQQVPKSVPQTINNVIQRTIEKVTTVQVPASTSESDKKKNNINNNESQSLSIIGGDILVSIYSDDGQEVLDSNVKNNQNILTSNQGPTIENQNEVITTKNADTEALGQGVIISDIGLVLVDSSILVGYDKYKVILDNTEFSVSVLKKYNNGFTVLKISTKQKVEDESQAKGPTTDKTVDQSFSVDNQ